METSCSVQSHKLANSTRIKQAKLYQSTLLTSHCSNELRTITITFLRKRIRSSAKFQPTRRTCSTAKSLLVHRPTLKSRIRAQAFASYSFTHPILPYSSHITAPQSTHTAPNAANKSDSSCSFKYPARSPCPTNFPALQLHTGVAQATHACALGGIRDPPGTATMIHGDVIGEDAVCEGTFWV